MDLSEEILHGLKVLELHDRDLRTLTIWCNPNNIYHTISKGGMTKAIVLRELESLEKKGIISRRKKMLTTLGYKQKKKEYELWSLIK